MNRWCFLWVDKILKEAYEKGVVLSGISAWWICWFESGHSDSRSFLNPDNWNYINVKWLWIIKKIHCPHFNWQTLRIKRRKNFVEFMKKHSKPGIAIDNNCAIEFIDDKYKVISSKKNANAYMVYKKNNKLISEKIPQMKSLTPISSLFSSIPCM